MPRGTNDFCFGAAVRAGLELKGGTRSFTLAEGQRVVLENR